MDCQNVILSRTVLFSCLVANILIGQIAFAEEVVQRIDGYVVSVDVPAQTFVVNYEIPATGERIEQKFDIGDSAGFKDFKKLSDLKKGDLVSLDFIDYKPTPKAVYVIRIPLKKVYFTPQEVAGALLKVKPENRKSNESKN